MGGYVGTYLAPGRKLEKYSFRRAFANCAAFLRVLRGALRPPSPIRKNLEPDPRRPAETSFFFFAISFTSTHSSLTTAVTSKYSSSASSAGVRYGSGMRQPKIRVLFYRSNRHYAAHYHTGDSHLCQSIPEALLYSGQTAL